MRKQRFYSIIALIAVIAILASTATCFAFFGTDSGTQTRVISEATGAKDSTVVSFVGTEFELRAASVDSAFNSPKHFQMRQAEKSSRSQTI